MNSQNKDKRLVAGCMTGTSLDALDIALVEITGKGLSMTTRIIRCLSYKFEDKLNSSLKGIAQQQQVSAEEISRTSHDFSLLHLTALKEVIGSDSVDLIAVHGQTVYHSPPYSWQLINPSIIAHGCEVPVIYDMRAADLALGGEGAPITPLADNVLFRSADVKRCVANLGGFCNVTVLPTSTDIGDIKGGDVSVCNQLLDQLARKLINRPYDINGAVALSGNVIDKPFRHLVELLSDQSAEQHSLGTGNESVEWLGNYRDSFTPRDLLRTACAAIVETIWKYVRPYQIDELILAGGGAYNIAVLEELRLRSAGVSVKLSDSLGIPTSYREAVAMSVLGALCQDRIPITLPQITGVTAAPISGCWVMP